MVEIVVTVYTHTSASTQSFIAIHLPIRTNVDLGFSEPLDATALFVSCFTRDEILESVKKPYFSDHWYLFSILDSTYECVRIA